MPFVTKANLTNIRRDMAVLAAVYSSLIAMAASLYPPLFSPLGAIVVGQMFLAPYLAAEHTGLPSEGSIDARTRSMKSNALLRFFLMKPKARGRGCGSRLPRGEGS